MMPARYCRRCGKELPPNASPRMAYCSDTCRKMASKRRRRDERAAAIHSQYKGIQAPRPKPLGDEEAGLLIAELESCALGLQAAAEAANPKAAPVLMRVAAGVLAVLESEGLHG